MRRTDIRELHYIAPIDNLPSIFKLGILSHKSADEILHCSVADEEVQKRRAAKEVSVRGGGRKPLHEYVPLYFTAHNWMLREVLGSGGDASVCMLKISSNVLDVTGAVVSVFNAARDKAKFYKHVDLGLDKLDAERVFARPPNERSQAEALIPDSVGPDLLIGAVVGLGSHLPQPPLFDHYDRVRSAAAAASSLRESFKVSIDPALFHDWERDQLWA